MFFFQKLSDLVPGWLYQTLPSCPIEPGRRHSKSYDEEKTIIRCHLKQSKASALNHDWVWLINDRWTKNLSELFLRSFGLLTKGTFDIWEISPENTVHLSQRERGFNFVCSNN